MTKIPSKKQIDENKPKYPLLPQEDYTLKIANLEEKTEENYNKNGQEDVVDITFEIVSLKDGSQPVDVEGEVAIGRKLWFKARPNSIGFMRDGTPAKTRQLIACLTNQDIFEEMEMGSWADFDGMNINAEVIQYIDDKGVKRNRISRFLPIKVKSKTDIPIIEDEN